MTLRDIIEFVKSTAEQCLDGEWDDDNGNHASWDLDFENEELTFIIERCRQLCEENSIKYEKPKAGPT